MAATERTLPYRGALSALIAADKLALFTSIHPEAQPMAVWRVDVDAGTLAQDPLPTGGTAILADPDSVFVGGVDGCVYKGPLGGGALSPLGAAGGGPVTALALLCRDRLAVLAGAEIRLIRRADGAQVGHFSLPDPGTALASDARGEWLVAGTSAGDLAVFDGESKPDFRAADSTRAHQSAVTALAFEEDELRVISVGADLKLLSTHVRGRLEPLDRGGRSMHDAPVRALLIGGASRFYTASQNRQIKAWERGLSRRQPSTTTDGVPGGVVALAIASIKGRPHLLAAAEDGTLCLFAVDAAGKLGDPAKIFRGDDAWAVAALAQPEPTAREAAIRQLAAMNDQMAVIRLAGAASGDEDARIRALAAQRLADSGHSRARVELQQLLSHDDPGVRGPAFQGLRRMEGPTSLDPLDRALAGRHADLGLAAVAALAERAGADEEARARLVAALEGPLPEVRAAALHHLAAVLTADPTEALRLALRCRRPDIRRLALIRALQGALLDRPSIDAALHRHLEDSDADVRVTAWLVGVLGRPALALALRALDRDLHRQLHELETFGQDNPPEAPAPKTKGLPTPDAADRAFLLQAMASRALDTCLRGAAGLAALQDPRAFGALLQLSRDPTPNARVAACKALQALGDRRATERLRSLLRDSAAEVRDAAFTALGRLLEDSAPLDAASAGLGVEHEDVRRRALDLAVRHARGKGAKAGRAAAIALVGRALDDAASSVRNEAFKASLRLDVGEGEEGPLRFCLQSIHAEVRGAVLQEIVARLAEPWARPLLLSLLDDADPGLRKEAFDVALDRAGTDKLHVLAAALRSRYADIRAAAAAALATKHNAGATALLVQALADADADVRRLAVDALVVDEAQEALSAALQAQHDDVRERAAAARAALGDPAALAPLLAALEVPAPESGDKKAWITRLVAALEGLGALGDPAALAPVSRLVDHAEAELRRAAAAALGTVSRPDRLDALRRALQHADAEVKIQAAVGLAFCGDAAGASLLSPAAPQPRRRGNAPPSISPAQALLAAAGLGPLGRDALLAALDHPDRAVWEAALVLNLLAEWAEGDGVPDRCLAALSSAHPRLRLAAARALESFADPDGFSAAVLEIFNDRGEGNAPWNVTLDELSPLAAALVGEDPQARVRAAMVLAERAGTVEAFRRALRRLTARGGLPAARAAAAAGRLSAAEIAELVFGAYVGLARLRGSSAEVRIQQTALSRLVGLATPPRGEAGRAEAVIPVLLQALSDPSQAVRAQAFEALRALGLPADRLGIEALGSDFRDVGAAGLQLLSEAAGGEAVLRQALLDRTDGLEREALRILCAAGDLVGSNALALEASSAGLRATAVAELARLAGEGVEGPARSALKAALGSRYRDVRLRAAEELAGWRDGAAFAPLVALLGEEDVATQRRATEALLRLGDPRAAAAFLDRADRELDEGGMVSLLLGHAGRLAHPSLPGDGAPILDRLFRALLDSRARDGAVQGILAASGHDQPVENPQEDGPDGSPPAWEQRQRARLDGVLARLLDELLALGQTGALRRLVNAARYARGSEPAASLARLSAHVDDGLRDAALEALGWRLRFRGGEAAPLLKALDNAALRSRLLAAEGLALSGRREGVSVLLASVDAMTEVPLRQRAIIALGHLADARALDTLLRLAEGEDESVRATALEALGHLHQTPDAAAIFKLLSATATGSRADLACSALRSLRWFGTTAAWDVIREMLETVNWRVRQEAAELLAFDPDEGALALLERSVTEENDEDVARAALASLQKRLGSANLGPLFAAARGESDLLTAEHLATLGAQGEAGPLMELIAFLKRHLDNEERVERAESLSAALLARDPLPLDAALARLDQEADAMGALCARLVGQAADPKAATPLAAAIGAALERLKASRAAGKEEELPGRVARLRAQLWAAARLAPGSEALEAATVAAASLEGPAELRPVREAAVAALAAGLGQGAALDALERAATGSDAALRALAADGLRVRDPARAAAVAGRLLDDPVALRALIGAAGETSALAAGLGVVHTQGAVLPLLVARGALDALKATAGDRALPLPTRLGALEGLAHLGTDAAEQALAALGASVEEEADLRKAAWRARRRSRRLRAHAAAPASEVRP